jgi:hypothetical protein
MLQGSMISPPAIPRALLEVERLTHEQVEDGFNSSHRGFCSLQRVHVNKRCDN